MSPAMTLFQRTRSGFILNGPLVEDEAPAEPSFNEPVQVSS